MQLEQTSAGLPQTVASRILINQSSVDGSTSAATLFTVVTSGVYRISMFCVVRTLSSTAWQINVDWTPPTGTHIAAQIGMAVNGNTGAVVSQPLNYALYLHAGDVITCGTVTGTGSNTGGVFDVSWILEQIA